MLTLTKDQEVLLRLPEPTAFLPKLAAEIRLDYPRPVSNLSDRALLEEVERSYQHASEVLRITHVATLVRWVKADVAWAKGMRSEPSVDLWIRSARIPNLTAADLLSNLAGR